jgi:hypothetical protein
MDKHTLQAANTAIRANDHCQNVQDLLHGIAQRLTSEDPQAPSHIEQAPSGSWQTTVRQSVQDIIFPAEITWMEGDDLLPDIKFADRALDEIKDRFTR